MFHCFDFVIDVFGIGFCLILVGVMTDELRSFLELNLPKVKEGKKPKFSLGLAEPKLGSHIFEATKIPCQSNEFVLELLRGVRQHFDRFIKDLKVCSPFYVFKRSCLFACFFWFVVLIDIFCLCSLVILKNLSLD